MSELKPCPFCGNEASAEGHIHYRTPLADAWWDDGSPITDAFFVNCVWCGAATRSGMVGGYRTKAEAVERWNTRATEAELLDALEGLELANERLCANRSKDTYDIMEREARDEMVKLDFARARARALITKHRT